MRILDYVRRITRRAGRMRRLGTSLPDILSWSRSFDVLGKEWLILGKGPSYQRISEVDPGRFHTLSLNHVVREQPVDLAHIIDVDVVDHVGDALERNARFVAMPLFPHVNHDPTERSLDHFVRRMPVLRRLSREKRLIWYNLSSARRRIDSSPLIVARFFSAEAAVNILAACGVKRIRSLGVDGGSAYAPRYDDLKDKTLLANRHPSFDRQFEEISRTIRTRGIFYAPLFKAAPIEVVIEGPHLLAAKVLEYSIRRHASRSVRCTLAGAAPPAAPPAGPIPGRAIHLQSDMLVLGDLSEAWDASSEGPGRLLPGDLPQDWRPAPYREGQSRLIQYAEPSTRPWLSPLHPEADRWYSSLKEGLAEGLIPPEVLHRSVSEGQALADLPRRLGFSPG